MAAWAGAVIGAIGLAVGFGVAWVWRRAPQLATTAGISRSYWPRGGWTALLRLTGKLFPDFTAPHTGRDITQTFRLLIAAMLVFGALLAIWAGSAAVMRAAWVYALRPDGLGAPPASANTSIVFPDGLHAWLFLLLEVLRALGGVMVLCLASGLVGAFLGFLFGIPRPISAAEAPPAAAGGTPLPGISRRKVWESSTNLTQVSDWLTKIIVGVSLVEARTAWTALQSVSAAAAGWLFAGRHGSPAVIPAAIVGGLLFGFLFCYLYTQLIVARLIALADVELGNPPDANTMQTIGDMKSFQEAMVPRISRRMSGFDAGAQPEQEELAAALKFRTIKLDDLTTRADVRNWARARALLNDYRSAADAYAQLIGMSDDGSVTDGPDLLIEAARVMNAAGDRPSEAAALAELALSELNTAPSLSAEAKEAVVGDCAALRLSRRVGGGYEAALKLLNDWLEGSKALPDASGRLHLLRALAKGQKWHAPAATQAEKDTLKTEIENDLRVAFNRKQRFGDIRPFWDLSLPRSPGRNPTDNEDDLAGIVDAASIGALGKPAQP